MTKREEAIKQTRLRVFKFLQFSVMNNNHIQNKHGFDLSTEALKKRLKNETNALGDPIHAASKFISEKAQNETVIWSLFRNESWMKITAWLKSQRGELHLEVMCDEVVGIVLTRNGKTVETRKVHFIFRKSNESELGFTISNAFPEI